MQAWLLPAACTLCGARVARGEDFCAGCARALPAITSCCRCCAAPYRAPDADAANTLCGSCQKRTPAFARVYAPFRYAAPIDRLIQGTKYNGRLDWARVLGRHLAEHIAAQAPSVDALVAVPLHRTRLRERGYNQSLELARPLAKKLGVPLKRGVERVRATPPQTELPRKQRAKNVRNAFAANGDVAGLRLAIVDDVMTSGATVEALARCLRKAGAKSVEVWVVARA